MPKINKRFAVTDPNRPAITERDELVSIKQLHEFTGKPYATVYYTMNRRQAPTPTIDHRDFPLWARGLALNYLADLGWKIPKVQP